MSNRQQSHALLVLAALAIALPAAPALAQGGLYFGAIVQFGSSASDTVGGVTRTGSSHYIVAGSTQGVLGSSGAGGLDVYLSRHDWNGTQLWVRQFGSPFDDFALAVDSDATGGSFVAGFTMGDVGGSGNLGGADGFVARYDDSGTRLWIRQFGTPQDDIVHALFNDGAGGFYIAGETHGSLAGPNAGGSDAFLARYDSAGTQLWIRQFGGGGSARAVVRDYPASGAYVAGDIDTGGQSDIFIARYDDAGNQIWMRQLGSSGSDHARALAFDFAAWGVFVGGSTTGNLAAPNLGSTDAWLARLDSAGNTAWINQFGASGADEIVALSPDPYGVTAAGSTEGSLFGASAGGRDAFIVQFGSSGAEYASKQFGTGEDDRALALTEGAVAGSSEGLLGASSTGSRDVFFITFGDVICYANCDGSWNPPPLLNVDDFICFINAFANASSLPHHLQIHQYANCDGSTIAPLLNVDDFICFINAFAAGCP